MSQFFVILVILVILGLMAIGLGIGYRARRREVGSKAAARDFRQGIGFMGVIILIGVGVYLFLPGIWRWETGSILMIVLVCAFIFTWLRHKKQAGSVLVDLGRTKLQKGLLFGGGCFVVSSIGSVVTSFLDAEGVLGIKEVSFGLLWLFSGVVMFLQGLSHLEIRKGGIFYLGNFFKWEKIESHVWEGENGLTLTLLVRKLLPFGRTLSLPIPANHKEAVENLLERYVPSEKNST